MRKYIVQILIYLLRRVTSPPAETTAPKLYVPIVTSPDNGLVLETITSGFLGHPVIYCIWKDNKMVAWSFDKVNWRMLSWFDRLPKPPPLGSV